MKRTTVATLGIVIALLMFGCGRGRAAVQSPGSPAPGVRADAAALGLRQVADIPLTGDTSRFDYESLDPTSGRLYIAHLGAGTVTVFDTRTQHVTGDITGVSGVHGVLAVPQLGRVYASATGDNQLVTIDALTMTVVARTEGGKYPDGIAYDPDDGKVFVSDEHGNTVTVVGTDTNQRIDTIDLGGEVGNTQYDSGSQRIFSVVQTRNQLIAIDPKADSVTGRYDLPGCAHSHGLYIDAAARLAFIACDENATLLTFDLQSMQITGTQTVGDSPDVLAFDEGLHRLYVAAESGVLAIFAERYGGLVKIGQDLAGPRAHAVAVDQQTHRIYLPLENSGGQPVLRIMEPLDVGTSGDIAQPISLAPRPTSAL
jgi:YVTN family beta-propeller protein